MERVSFFMGEGLIGGTRGERRGTDWWEEMRDARAASAVGGTGGDVGA